MNKKIIPIIIVLFALAAVVLVISDFGSTKIENRKGNAYELDIEGYKNVDESLIKYKETRQLKVSGNPHGLAYYNRELFVLVDSGLLIINTTGEIRQQLQLSNTGNCLAVSGNFIFIGYNNQLIKYSLSGDVISSSNHSNDKSIFTSVAVNAEHVFVADAGNRKVLVFNESLEKTGEFSGVSGAESVHGFIVPSAYFDLAIADDNKLWAVNPGMHAIQNYNQQGDLLEYWKKESNNIEGFSGCCNPAHIALLPNGNFVTSEKKIVRIKEYSAKGELLAVVAPPSKFTNDGKAPEVCPDDQGNIWALDFDKKMIRLFVKE